MDMRTLRRNTLNDKFASQIDRLKIAFGAASAPLHAEIKQVQIGLDDFHKNVRAREAAVGPTSDPGKYMEDQMDEGDLRERIDDELETLLTLRKAFIVLIYHQWERMTLRRTKLSKGSHEDLVKAAKADGIPLDEPSLRILQFLVNTIKHNSSKYGPELYKMRCDMFNDDFDPNAVNPLTNELFSNILWADKIELNDEHICEFIETIRKSLPC